MSTSYALDRIGGDRHSSVDVRRELDLWLKVCALSATQLSGVQRLVHPDRTRRARHRGSRDERARTAAGRSAARGRTPS